MKMRVRDGLPGDAALYQITEWSDGRDELSMEAQSSAKVLRHLRHRQGSQSRGAIARNEVGKCRV